MDADTSRSQERSRRCLGRAAADETIDVALVLDGPPQPGPLAVASSAEDWTAGRGDGSTGTRQLDFVFASGALAPTVSVRADNG